MTNPLHRVCLAFVIALQILTINMAEAKQRSIYFKQLQRSYERPLSSEEKKNISYIVNTLGNASLFTIARQKASLQKAGKEVESIHPLIFLGYIFGEEKLKAAMQNMKSRGWIWREFTEGLKGSLEEEAQNYNLTEEQLADFAAKIQIDVKTILSLAEERRWKDFLLKVMDEVPRNPYANRYNM